MSLLLALLLGGGAATITGSPAVVSVVAVDATLAPGAVSITGSSALLSLVALDGALAPGDVSITGSPAALALTALDGSLSAGAVTLSGSPATLSLIALDGAATPSTVSITGGPAALALTAIDALLDAVLGVNGPVVDRRTLAASYERRALSTAIEIRALSSSTESRALASAVEIRLLSTAIETRSLVSSISKITKGHTTRAVYTLTGSLSGSASTIAEPTSLAVKLYPLGSTVEAASITITPGDCTGWGTTSVVVPCTYNAINTAALTGGQRYNVEIHATYADGVQAWPAGTSNSLVEIEAPGAT